MKMVRSLVIAATTALLFCASLSTAMAKDEAKRIEGAARALKEISAIQKNVIPPALVDSATAVVIIPGAAKSDFMVRGRSAGGVLLVHDKEGKWSNPVFITLSGGTLGWQIVAEPMDIFLFFKNRERVEAIMKNKLYFDINVKMTPGLLAKTMKTQIKEDQKTEIDSYVRSHGKFADVTVDTTTVQVDNAANDAFYGKPKTGAEDIVTGKVEKSGADVKVLQKLLTDYAAKQ